MERRDFLVKSAGVAGFFLTNPLRVNAKGGKNIIDEDPDGDPIYQMRKLDTHVHTKYSNTKKLSDLDHLKAPEPYEMGNLVMKNGNGILIADHAEILSNSDWEKLNIMQGYINQRNGFAMRGFEWTNGTALNQDFNRRYAHMVICGIDKFVGTRRILRDSSCDIAKSYEELWEWLSGKVEEGKTIINFAHPWNGLWQFDNFNLSNTMKQNGWYNTCLIEIASSSLPSVSVGMKYYFDAVAKCWKVAPCFGSDNWGPPGVLKTYTGVVDISNYGTDYSGIVSSLLLRYTFVSEVPDANVYCYIDSDYHDGYITMGFHDADYYFSGPFNKFKVVMDENTRRIFQGYTVYLVYDNVIREYHGRSFSQNDSVIREILAGLKPRNLRALITRVRTSKGDIVLAPIYFENITEGTIRSGRK